MDKAAFDDGVRVSVELQELIIRLIRENHKPGAIAFSTLAIGAGMLVQHHGKEKARKIVNAMMDEARDGKINLYPAILAANENSGKPDI